MVPSWNLAVWLGTAVINNAHDGADVTTVRGNQNSLFRCFVVRRHRWHELHVGGRQNKIGEGVRVVERSAAHRCYWWLRTSAATPSSLSWRFTSWYDVGPHPIVWYTASDGYPTIRFRAATLEWMQSFCFKWLCATFLK